MECEKILFSRLIISFMWSFVLHIFPLSVYILITNFDIVHPFQWVINSTVLVFSIGTWVSLVPLQGLVFALGYVSSQELKKPRNLITSRFKLLCSFFQRNNILKCGLHVFIGATLPWTYLKLNNVALTKQCQDSAQNLCLEEDSIFIVACGIWTSVYYFIRFNLLTDTYLQFPIIRQLRFLQIRSKFITAFKNCFKASFIPFFYFLLFYFWYARQVTSSFEFFLSSPLETSKLSTVSGLFKTSLLFKAYLISTVYFSIVDVLQLMIQIHFTEHYSFELMRQPNLNSVLLATAIGEQNVPIIQHLGCYDLFILSTSQKSNRWQVFTLSQPGGHPHTWDGILHESIKLIDKFICEIQEIYKVPEPVKPVSPVPRHYHVRDRTIRHEEIISGPVPLSPTSKIRSLVDRPQSPPIKQQPSAMDELWGKVESYVSILEQNSVISYVFGSKPDAKIRFLVSNSQPVIWVVQSLAELSASALMEDQFGIVLKDLPLIINTLIRLKFSLDKMGNIQKKLQKRDHDLCMKASLKSALRRSLYRIAIAYSDYLTDLPLPPENLACMKNFVNFKEC